MLLIPVHYTALAVAPGDVTLKAGDELKLKVTLSGRPVSSGSMDVPGEETRLGAVGPRRRWRPVVVPKNLRGHWLAALTTGLKDCQADLDYRVVAGELESRVFHVKVMHPLLLKGVEAAITPPAYTRKPPEVVKAGSFKAIEGSRVQLTITASNHPATRASLVLASTRNNLAAKRCRSIIDEAPKLTRMLHSDRQGPGISH